MAAFSILAKSNRSLTLEFVGRDDGIRSEDGVLYKWQDYLDQFVEPELQSRIRFRGLLTPEQIAPLRARSFVTVVASRYENFPNVCVEAMAYGCPLVAAAVGGIPEIIDDKRNGLLVSPGDAEDLSSKIQRLLDSPNLATQIGNAAWTDCEERFAARRIAERMFTFYRSVCSESHAGLLTKKPTD